MQSQTAHCLKIKLSSFEIYCNQKQNFLFFSSSSASKTLLIHYHQYQKWAIGCLWILLQSHILCCTWLMQFWSVWTSFTLTLIWPHLTRVLQGLAQLSAVYVLGLSTGWSTQNDLHVIIWRTVLKKYFILYFCSENFCYLYVLTEINSDDVFYIMSHWFWFDLKWFISL